MQAHSRTVTVLDGSVFARHAGGEFAPITDGDIVAGGDTIRTAAESHGVLTCFDGTTVELEPDTEITVATLEASAAGDKIDAGADRATVPEDLQRPVPRLLVAH